MCYHLAVASLKMSLYFYLHFCDSESKCFLYFEELTFFHKQLSEPALSLKTTLSLIPFININTVQEFVQYLRRFFQSSSVILVFVYDHCVQRFLNPLPLLSFIHSLYFLSRLSLLYLQHHNTTRMQQTHGFTSFELHTAIYRCLPLFFKWIF